MGMEKLLLTNSSKGVNRHSALSTALKASVSQLLLSRNSAVSATQHPAKERQPSVKLLLRSPATLDWVEYDEETNTTLFRLVVTNGRKNALEVTKANFAVKAEGYLAYQNDKLQVIYPDSLSHQVKQGETFTYYVKAKDLNALTDGPVTLTYYPDLQYSEFSANWELAADVLEPELPGTSTN